MQRILQSIDFVDLIVAFAFLFLLVTVSLGVNQAADAAKWITEILLFFIGKKMPQTINNSTNSSSN